MSKFIPIKDFLKKHSVGEGHFYVKMNQGAYPRSVLFRIKRGETFIDEEFFVKRREFKRRVWLESHDMYYFLTKHNSRIYLARLLHKIDNDITVSTWNSFLHTSLFRIQSENILNFKAEGLFMKFYRYARWLIRALFIKVGISVDERKISVLLDRY